MQKKPYQNTTENKLKMILTFRDYHYIKQEINCATILKVLGFGYHNITTNKALHRASIPVSAFLFIVNCHVSVIFISLCSVSVIFHTQDTNA